jgi:hypothetical protein
MRHLILFALLSPAAALSGCSLVDRISGNSDDCSGPVAYTAGTTVTDTLGVRNCRGPSGEAGRLYTMTLAQQGNLWVSASSGAFTPRLKLYTADNTDLSEAYEAPVLKVFLPAGNYQLFVARTSGQDGPFTLSSPTSSLGGSCSTTTGTLTDDDMGITALGAEFDGILTTADCGAVNARTHWYRFFLSSGDTLNLSVTSDRAAGFSLVGTEGTAVASKELPGAGVWSHTYVATANGTMTLRLESRLGEASGGLPLHYSVSLH